MITITQQAATKVLSLLKDKEHSTGIRVGVKGGGCSGFSYFLDFADAAESSDREITSNGVKLFIDSKSFIYLMGTEIDYIDGLNQSGFQFNNPGAKRTCGCGESFSI